MVKNPPANAGEAGLIPGSGRSPKKGNGNSFQCSCLGNPTDRGAWGATIHESQRVRHDSATKQQQCCMPTTDIILYLNYTSMEKKRSSNRTGFSCCLLQRSQELRPLTPPLTSHPHPPTPRKEGQRSWAGHSPAAHAQEKAGEGHQVTLVPGVGEVEMQAAAQWGLVGVCPGSPHGQAAQAAAQALAELLTEQGEGPEVE